MIDEAIEQFGLREGDRIGHGLVLGIDARGWARRAGRIVMMKEERLFDLIWQWRWHGQQGGDVRPERIVFLQHEIDRLSGNIFGEPWMPHELFLLQQDLYNPERLYDAGFPDRLVSFVRDANGSVVRVACSDSVISSPTRGYFIVAGNSFG